MDASSGTESLADGFRLLFELVPALDDASREQVFRIRHDVYCRDLGWEPERADGLEQDAYDRHAVHCLLRRRGGGEPVGCTRLILTRPEAPHEPLPFEESCRDVLDRAIVDPATTPRHEIGEVSRLAVLGAFRQRKGESTQPAPMQDADFAAVAGRTRFPYIPVSLYLGAAAIARRFGVEHVFVLTEPRLASHFTRIGFDIRRVGGTIEHRGTRVPSLLSSSRVVEHLRPTIRPLYEEIAGAVEAGFAAHPDAARWAGRPPG